MIVIYGTSISPYVRKALVFAIEKGIAFEPRPGGPRAADPDFARASPFASMALVDCQVDAKSHPKTARYLEAILARPSCATLLQQERAFLAA